jgi:hypothetical protein
VMEYPLWRFFNEDSLSSNKRGTPILWAIAEIKGMPARGVIKGNV